MIIMIFFAVRNSPATADHGAMFLVQSFMPYMLLCYSYMHCSFYNLLFIAKGTASRSTSFNKLQNPNKDSSIKM